MDQLIERMQRVERAISQERGEFALFALFKRYDVEVPKWDLVVSAYWFSSKQQDLVYFLNNLTEAFAYNLEFLGSIHLFSPEEDLVQSINQLVRIQHDNAELKQVMINGIRIGHCHIITSQRLSGASIENSSRREGAQIRS